ncbi:MAG TPA: thiamine pyrophosphate-binding protein, partial [Miltoncostaeaceae bacterium]|nr:thiamine pyrophosphate-binding protein [Miltoncostaeaceae bacterium]
SIENGLLRCPWHGYDYDPLTGNPPPPFTDAACSFPVQVREDGIYVGLPPEPQHVRTVSDVMAETLVNWGVTHVFGMVGHSNLGFADALHRLEDAGRLRYIGIRHEGAAAFAASAYGKITGRPGACFAIAGPGSTNLLTGLYDAKVDSAPVIAISGQVPSKVLGRGAFQDLDLTGAFSDVALTSRTIYAESNHAEMVSRAAKAAIEQRGVAHLVLPDEVQVLPAADGATPGAPVGRMADRAIRPPEGVLNEALDLLNAAKRPVIVLGHGARGAVGDITALAERLGAPIITTFKAKGLVPDDHPLAGGALGRSGTPIASWLMNESDLLLVFGASFSDHTGISPYTPIIQVDDQPASLGRFQPVTVPVLGDTGETARLMLAGLADAIAAVDQRADVAARHAIWRAEKQRRAGDDRGLGVASAAIFAALTDAVAADAVIAVDVGNNTYSFGRYFECRRQTVVMSGYLGSIGFALPAAMGGVGGRAGRRIRSPGGGGRRGRRLRPVHGRVDHRGQVRHEHHHRAAQQRPAGQDQQGTARGRTGRVADLAAQPRLRRLRPTVRRPRRAGERPDPPGRGPGGRPRPRWAGAGRDHQRPRAGVTPLARRPAAVGAVRVGALMDLAFFGGTALNCRLRRPKFGGRHPCACQATPRRGRTGRTMTDTPSICYLLPPAASRDTVGLALRQAEALHRIGFDVPLATTESAPATDTAVPVALLPDFGGRNLPQADCYIGTNWLTAAVAHGTGLGIGMHLIEEYEGDAAENVAARGQIEQIYRLGTVKLIPEGDEQLARLVRERFGQEAIPLPVVPDVDAPDDATSALDVVAGRLGDVIRNLAAEQRERWLVCDERMVPGEADPLTEVTHFQRYEYAAPHAAGARVIDVGCGVGYGSRQYALAGARSVVAIDRSPHALRYAQEHFDHPAITWRESDVFTFDWPDRGADLIICFEVFEHVDRSAVLLDHMVESLADDGRLFISTPNRVWSSPVGEPRNVHHVREYELEEFVALLGSFFERVTVVGQGMSDGRVEIGEPDAEHDIIFIAICDRPIRREKDASGARRMVAAPDWNAPEQWEPLIDRWCDGTLPVDADTLVLLAHSPRGAEHLLVERLQRLRLDPATVPDIEVRSGFGLKSLVAALHDADACVPMGADASRQRRMAECFGIPCVDGAAQR